MKRYGRNTVQVRCHGCADILSLGFKMTGVTRRLVVVRRIVDLGKEVVLGQCGGRIVDRAREMDIPLERRGGCRVFKANLISELEGLTKQA